MNRKQTITALRVARKLGVTINLIAPHGESKSSLIKQYAKMEGMNYTEFRTGQAADAGDLTGLPEFMMMKCPESLEEYKVTNFVLPAWFPRKKNTVVFFDEVNRGAKDILNGIFEAILDLSMKGIPMPEGCQVVTAMNPPTSDYSGTLDFDDKAWLDRFVHVNFQPTHAEFIEYYRSLYNTGSAVDFLADREEMMRVKGEKYQLGQIVTPSPRSWETAMKLEALYDSGEIKGLDEGVFSEFLFGTIGETATLAFKAFKATNVKSIKAVDLIERYNEKEIREQLLKAIKKNSKDMIGLAFTELDKEFSERKGLNNQEARNIIDLARDVVKLPEYQQVLMQLITKHTMNCTGNCEGFEVVQNGRGLAYSKELIEIQTKLFEARKAMQAAGDAAKAKKAANKKVQETEEV